VNCGGPWSARLAERLDRPAPDLFRPSLALNLYLDRAPLAEYALAVAPRRPGGRVYFMYPWKGGVLAGTHHLPWVSGTRDDPAAVERAVESLIAQLNDAVPGWSLSRDDVVRVHWGLLPARRDGTADLATRPALRDHGAAGGPDGLYSVSGVKFTTARLVGETTLWRIARRGQLPPLDAQRAPRPAPVTPPDAETMIALAARNRAAAAGWVRQLSIEESVCRADDLLLRRTDWGVHPERAGILGPLVAELFRPLRASASVEAVR
jgi:glycerol-3-phosphate dehydrogenase